MLLKDKHFHFIGICGIGMSGIAKILLTQGYKVSGCDRALDPQRTQELIDLGCTIGTHQSDVCTDPSINIIVRSSDVAITHPEIIAAKERNIPVMLRAEVLAKIMQELTSIAVAGAHGKTTTSSMLGHVLLQANFDPTIIVGGHMHNLNSNAYAGSGKLAAIESDESDRSFLILPKVYSIITNIDREHLGTYKDFDDIKQAFVAFANDLPSHGLNILCIDDAGIQSVINQIKTPYITYGTSDQATIKIDSIVLEAAKSHFHLTDTRTHTDLGTYTVPMPGHHNVLNATAVIAMCLHLGATPEAIKLGLESFKGIDRRFTFKGVSKINGALIFDDYGHHPTEITATLSVARAATQGKLIVVFQPQRYSRTKHLWQDFVQTLAAAPVDQLILTDIYPASEQPIEGITSDKLVAEIKALNPNLNIQFIPFEQDGKNIVSQILANTSQKDLILFQGAGKVNKLAPYLL